MVIIRIFLVTSLSISIWENPEEKHFVSTKLKQYFDVSSKQKTSLQASLLQLPLYKYKQT